MLAGEWGNGLDWIVPTPVPGVGREAFVCRCKDCDAPQRTSNVNVNVQSAKDDETVKRYKGRRTVSRALGSAISRRGEWSEWSRRVGNEGA